MGITIKDAPLVEQLSGYEKIPISDGSNEPKTVNIEQIKEFANKDIEIPTKVSELENDSDYATSKEVEDAISKIPTPDVGGQISAALVDYVKKVEGKGLSTNDFTNELKEKLEGITPYDPSELEAEIGKLETAINTLVGGNASNAIESFNEIIAFLKNVSDTESLSGIIAGINASIAEVDAKIPTKVSELENDKNYLTEHQSLSHLATKDELKSKQDVISDLANIREGAAKGATAIQEEQYKGTIAAVDTNESVDDPNVPSGSYDDTELKNQIANLETEVSKKADEAETASKLSELGSEVGLVSTVTNNIDYKDLEYEYGYWGIKDGKVIAVGDENKTSVRFNRIPINNGQRFVCTASASTEYMSTIITDAEGNVIFSKKAGADMYAPEGSAFLYITSALAYFSCIVYGVFDSQTYYRNKLRKLCGEDITFPNRGYYSVTGAWVSSASYYCTDKIAVSTNSKLVTNATYIACWNLKNEWIGRYGRNDELPNDTAYISIFDQQEDIYIKYESDSSNLPNREEFNAIQRKLSQINDTTTSFKANLRNKADVSGNKISVISGEAGEIGAKYEVPIHVNKGYAICIKFKMPSDLHDLEYSRELINFGTRQSSRTNGFSVGIISKKPTNALSQVLCTSSMEFYPTTSTTNNYVGKVNVGGVTIKEFVGDVVASIRYIGELSTSIVYTMEEDKLRIFDKSSNVDILNIAYPEDNLMTSLIKLLENNSEVIEVVGYNAEGVSISDVIKGVEIPLVGVYESKMDAFPSYILQKDSEYHTLEVRFDASKDSGTDMISGYIDGQRFYHVDGGYKVYGDGVFDSVIKFGCDGVEIQSIEIAPTLKSDIPNIIALCQHQINPDDKYNGSNPQNNLASTYGRMGHIIRLFKKYGFKYITSEQIKGYLLNGLEVPQNSYTIIHDDYFYVRDNIDNINALALRKLYLSEGLKVSFGIIPSYVNDEVVAEINKDRDVFEFLVHDDYTLVSSKGYQNVKNRIESNLQKFKNKLNTCNIWIYTGGLHDANTSRMLQSYGMCMAYYTSETTTSGGINKFNYLMALPRFYCDDSRPISQLEDVLVELIKH